MNQFRVIAIPTIIARQVRTSNKAPRYGHPAFTETAKGYGPCRHCLRTFDIGKESRTLFTYDAFEGIESVPLPGPIFIHTNDCERYPENGGYPRDLLSHAAVLSGYVKGQRLAAQLHAEKGSHEQAVQQLLQRSDVDYIEVRDKIAGCYDFRIERAAQR
jgi:hypothetical protein